jgi:hypothetical protein
MIRAYFVDGQVVRAARDGDVVAVGSVVTGCLQVYFIPDDTEMLLVEDQVGDAAAHPQARSDAFGTVDGDVAGAVQNTDRDDARRQRERQLYTAGATFDLEEAKLQPAQAGSEPGDAASELDLPGDPCTKHDLTGALAAGVVERPEARIVDGDSAPLHPHRGCRLFEAGALEVIRRGIRPDDEMGGTPHQDDASATRRTGWSSERALPIAPRALHSPGLSVEAACFASKGAA